MSKKKRVPIAPLVVTDETRSNVRNLMKRMVDSPAPDEVEVHQEEEKGAHQLESVEVHREEKRSAHQTEPVAVPDAVPVEVHKAQPSEVHRPAVEGMPSTKKAVVEVRTATAKKVEVHHKRPVDRRHGDRHAKDRIKWSGRFRPEIWQMISGFCVKHGNMEKLYFFELAAVHFIEAVEVHHTAKVEGMPSHDDLMIWKTIDDIIMRYEQITGNKWKPTDDRVGQQFNQVDPRWIEIGMLNTILRFKGKKIHSFAYFKPEIEFTIDEMKEAKLDTSTIDIMLKRRREQVQKKLSQ